MDPLTIALISKGVISGAKAIQGAVQASKARDLEEETMAKGMPRLQTPSEYYQLYKASQRDKAMEAEIAQAQQAQAANVEALSQAGSRALLGGLPSVTAATQQAVADAARRGYQREQAGLQALANAQQRTGEINYRADLSQYTNDLNRARAGFQAGVETMYGGLEGVAATAIGLDDNFGNRVVQSADAQISTPEAPFGKEVEGVRTQEMIDFYDMSNPFPLPPKKEAKEEKEVNVDFGSYRDSFNTSGRPFGDDALFLFPFTPNREKGGPITTEGDFDHNSNPLHVVNNNGEKVAEVTGQETLVYNPKQRQLMKKIMNRLVNKGSVSLSQSEKEEAKNVLKAFQQ